MNLEDYIQSSVLPKIQVTSMYFKPNIPKEKLTNAIREYAFNVSMESVLILIDETFWGSAKEGFIFTNDKIISSKKFGGLNVDLSLINDVSIKDKTLILNSKPVAKLSNPELMPCAVLGNVLNEFINASKNSIDSTANLSILESSKLDSLQKFLTGFVQPRYFDSVEVQHRRFSVNPSYNLVSSLPDKQVKLVSFKGRFALNEQLLCVSWLDGHDTKDYFFCVTNCGVHSIKIGTTPLFISHEELANMRVLEEYIDGRYVGVRFVCGKQIITSIKNHFLKSVGFDIISGLIDILNGHHVTGMAPVDRVNHSTEFDKIGINLVEKILKESYASMEEGIKVDTGYDAEFDNLFFGCFRSIFNILISDSVRKNLWPKGCSTEDEMLSVYIFLISVVYTNSMQSLPREFQSGMGDAWFNIISLPILLLENIENTVKSYGLNFSADREFIMIAQCLTSDLGRMHDRNSDFLDRILQNAGVNSTTEFAILALKKFNISEGVINYLLEQSLSIAKSWYKNIEREFLKERFD